MAHKPVSLKFPFTDEVTNRRKGMVVGWLTVFSIVGVVSVASFSVFSSQQSIAQTSERTSFVRGENRSQQIERLKRQRLAHSIAVLTRGMKSQPASNSDSSNPQESQTSGSGKGTQRTMGAYMEAISVVYAAIAPQRQPAKPARQPAP
ncbi:MAG: hypothetical protein K6T90_03195 [Leptolyngbyaceae cyanobacterium HOT.MB2.61]|nr:hypothetical protein [Leptolyngbyaceae cyanobacterium HOT.MB2.61]